MMREETASDRTALYRVYDSAGALLYIGISFKPLIRLADHRRTKHWFGDAAKVTFEYFANRAEAEMAEIQAVTTENPQHNIRFKDTVAAWQQERRAA